VCFYRYYLSFLRARSFFFKTPMDLSRAVNVLFGIFISNIFSMFQKCFKSTDDLCSEGEIRLTFSYN
jgi:hypothetical protein